MAIIKMQSAKSAPKSDIFVGVDSFIPEGKAQDDAITMVYVGPEDRKEHGQPSKSKWASLSASVNKMRMLFALTGQDSSVLADILQHILEEHCPQDTDVTSIVEAMDKFVLAYLDMRYACHKQVEGISSNATLLEALMDQETAA